MAVYDTYLFLSVIAVTSVKFEKVSTIGPHHLDAARRTHWSGLELMGTSTKEMNEHCVSETESVYCRCYCLHVNCEQKGSITARV